MTRHQFAGAAPTVHSTGSINNTDLSVTATETSTAYPDGSVGPFVICMDRGVAGTEEKMLCSGRVGSVFTITNRGYDGTTATSHAAGATIDHVLDAVTVDGHDAHVWDTTRNDHTQYPNKSLWAAKGTMLSGSGAGTVAATAVGADGTVWTADAASTGGAKWAGASGGLLAIKQYAAGADGAYTVTNDNTLRALDTTNLTVSPVIPASGNVIVRQQIVVSSTDTVANRLYIGIRVHGASTQVGLVILLDGSSRASGTLLETFNVSQYITGLTPGAATWDFAYISNTAATALWKGTGISGGVSPTVMEVWAA